MRATGRIAMAKMQSGKRSFLTNRARWLRALGIGLLFGFASSETALAQEVAVTGRVTNASGTPLRGVAVRVQGTTTRVLTDANGRYTVTAPPNGVLDFTLLGQRSTQLTVRGRSTIDVAMTPIAFLQEMVVTAYAEMRSADITGEVASDCVEPI